MGGGAEGGFGGGGVGEWSWEVRGEGGVEWKGWRAGWVERGVGVGGGVWGGGLQNVSVEGGE